MSNIGTATAKREIYGTATIYDYCLEDKTQREHNHRVARIRESDPEGRIVEHFHVVTQSYLDRLHADLLISDDERDAGQLLADDHYAAGLFMASMAVVDPGKPIGGGGGNIDLVRGEEAFARYQAALRSVTTYAGRDTLIRACIDEREVRMDWLHAALADLIRYYRKERRKTQ